MRTKGKWKARCMGSEGSVVWLDTLKVSKELRSLSPIADCTARPFDESVANAEFICTAVNNHDMLVDKLKATIRLINTNTNQYFLTNDGGISDSNYTFCCEIKDLLKELEA